MENAETCTDDIADLHLAEPIASEALSTSIEPDASEIPPLVPNNDSPAHDDGEALVDEVFRASNKSSDSDDSSDEPPCNTVFSKLHAVDEKEKRSNQQTHRRRSESDKEDCIKEERSASPLVSDSVPNETDVSPIDESMYFSDGGYQRATKLKGKKTKKVTFATGTAPPSAPGVAVGIVRHEFSQQGGFMEYHVQVRYR